MPPPDKKPWPFRIEYPPELPISARADEIIAAIRDHQVLILAGETGSGKTTQIPKFCLVAGRGEHGRIACTQPRRVAATSVARRVAEELNVDFGREVGCKIRFADQTSGATVVKFMTDGMLLAELQADPDLREYDTIIVDEAHERSLNIDFILGHLRRLRHHRPGLKIIITSATIDTAAFSKAFDDAPIIEVSGRVYPVEVIWSPLEEMVGAVAPNGPRKEGKAEKAVEGNRPYRDERSKDEFTYIDAAVEAVTRVLHESTQGDVLVFLPTERDIREMSDLLEGRKFPRVEVVPLYGRLTNAEQQRVFAPSGGRKVVVATNIAETSLTIPGIRFVIDSGLARISRYAPLSHTRRLPVEPVAQSSADQRKGRCGRVSDGVCIRLYSEQDYLDRPRFTQPEIQRANLADVILRMKAFGLGDIEEFPFLNVPPAKGIRAGYALLEELGALARGRAGSPNPAGAEARKDQAKRGLETLPCNEWELTDLGHALAQLPVDPTVGRMILQARTEKAQREVLIIAAALSIQDPRERPADQREKAEAAHRRFVHPDSDFLTLLAIWEAYHDEFERMTLGKLRKFCTAHFLSFLRMREWRDVHAQLEETLRERDGFAGSSVYDGLKKGQPLKLALGTPAYAAIHRSILSGLLGNIAVRTDDGDYHAAHDRKVGIFPGSALFDRKESTRKTPVAKARGTAQPAKRIVRWLMAAEVMETGRIYARTCARIDPHWVLDLGAHLVRSSYSEPFWDADGGRVLAKERRRVYNLELETRAVAFGRIDPTQAVEIFIREGLVGDTIRWPFEFLAHNRRLRAEIEALLTRTRSAGYMNLDEVVYRFYAQQLMPDEGRAGPPLLAARRGTESATYQGVSSVAELVDLVRHRQASDPKFLFMTEADLQPPAEAQPDPAAFPATVPIYNRVLPLSYAYQPGQEADGVTLRVGLAEAEALTPAMLDWAVPGHLAEKVELMLKALPKEQRRDLIPLAETARKLTTELALLRARAEPPTLADALAELLAPRLGARIDPRQWADKPLPDYLRVRVEVLDAKGRALWAGRDLAQLREQLHLRARDVSKQAAAGDIGAWRAARAKWETAPATQWDFGDLPEEVMVSEHHGVPVRAYPGLQAFPAGVAVRLFTTPEEARAASRAGLAQLFETQLRHDLGWLEKDLKALRTLGPVAVTLTTPETLRADALQSIRVWACGREVEPLHAAEFTRQVGEAKRELRGVVSKLTDWLKEVFTLRLALETHKQPYPWLAEDLAALLPPDFLCRVPFGRVRDLPRYLRGMLARADRWRKDVAKDAQRADILAPFARAAAALAEKAPADPRTRHFRWLVEEFRVSLFAQDLGTAEPVSAVRLERLLAELQLPGGATGPAPQTRAAAPAARLAKGPPLKSLGALDQLFRK
ncbi:MAG TPA: ATP-dependent RNA helicase HrpA [Lacunisphaera sp.]|nr:ATP-dependent RNA helicase HrpA [Lacunisphaera sp.]